MTYCVYGACRVDLEPKNCDQLIAINIKVGKTTQESETYNYPTPADKRMSQHWTQYHNGDTASICHKHKHNIDNGKYEYDYWVNWGFGGTRPLCENNLFYDSYENDCVSMLKAEQVLHNTIRKWAKKFTNTQTKIVLHEGLPYKEDGSFNKLTNPYPAIGGEPTNEIFLKQLEERIKNGLESEKQKKLKYNKEQLEKKTKELSDLGVSFEAQMQKINEISI
tara:strand:+ start:17454 stop:18116 length:663 start_codon:yes stop_codon:yes gene_type:complete